MKAFPNGMITDDRGVIVSSQPGMDLRDYFAAKAMQGFIAALVNDDSVVPYTHITAMAYKMADVMVEARNGTL